MILCFNIVETPEEKRKFEKLYMQYRKMMYYVAYGILKDSYRSEDAVHQAFIKVMYHLDKIEESNVDRTKAFLVLITEHVAIDLYRKLKRETMLSYEEASQYIGAISGEIGSYDHEIYDVIVKLPLHYRTILMLKYAHGYKDEEIATLLDMTSSNVRQRISRAKRKLQQMLDEQEG